MNNNVSQEKIILTMTQEQKQDLYELNLISQYYIKEIRNQIIKINELIACGKKENIKNEFDKFHFLFARASEKIKQCYIFLNDLYEQNEQEKEQKNEKKLNENDVPNSYLE
ncbi:TPA: hypothetical protein R9114_001739 [Campylobacter upsaliensis]|uniref:hypothetical protein n=1 Tax=Campylobacter helveticus TaxID=28898 RepID=UPI00126DFEF9|nr:hypothetical protein [Campylobacter helveticus]EAK3283097.1 hypothetical protein [Campylobacter upsaliensis]EHD3050251.1 hypothetical protein [Campylobacter upsaliensis]MCR2060361.1 hypothetical protein [Campylobacter helveticus]HEF3537893.1 hypothetical protein [Campylobacter upsaliensis]